jgi:ABC-type glutathione transport system ATPase component
MTAPLLQIEDVTVEIQTRRERALRRGAALRALDGVSLTLHSSRTMGLVGESGAGKSTLAFTIMGVRRPSSGRVYFNDRDISTLSRRDLKRYHRDVQLIFQDPASALNPRMTLRQIVTEPMIVHGLNGSRARRADVARDLMARCGLSQTMADVYPHALSGGQRQRAAVARALAAQPRLIIADEPTSAVDVSIQAQVLALLCELQRELGIAYLLISHDLAVIRRTAHDIAVMYGGRVVEFGTTADVFEHPEHSYTSMLLDAYVLPDRYRGAKDSFCSVCSSNR